MKFYENLDFDKILVKFSILVKMFENLDFGQNCCKI